MKKYKYPVEEIWGFKKEEEERKNKGENEKEIVDFKLDYQLKELNKELTKK